jgi:hypothetical protein
VLRQDPGHDAPSRQSGTGAGCLLRLARDFTPCLRHLTEFVRRHRDGSPFDGPTMLVLKDWLASIVRSHGPRGHDFEVCWVLAIHSLLGGAGGGLDTTPDGRSCAWSSASSSPTKTASSMACRQHARFA